MAVIQTIVAREMLCVTVIARKAVGKGLNVMFTPSKLMGVTFLCYRERGPHNNINFRNLTDFIYCSFTVSTLISGCCKELKALIVREQYTGCFTTLGHNCRR